MYIQYTHEAKHNKINVGCHPVLWAKHDASVSRIQHNTYLPTFWHQIHILKCSTLLQIVHNWQNPKLSNPDGNLLSSDPFRMCYINFSTRCLRLTASNMINQKKQKVWSEVWPTALWCVWKKWEQISHIKQKKSYKV